MRKPDLLIFDCDGVLVDSEVLSCRCLSEVLAGYGIDLGLDQALDLFLGRSTAAVLEHYEGSEQLIPEKFSIELAARVREAFLAALCPIEGVSSVPRRWWKGASQRLISFSTRLTGCGQIRAARS